MKTTKILILALLIDAAAVSVMQFVRWRGAWLFVTLYWVILTVKNYVDWRKSNRTTFNGGDRS